MFRSLKEKALERFSWQVASICVSLTDSVSLLSCVCQSKEACLCCPVFARVKKTLTLSRMYFAEDGMFDTLKYSCFDLVMLKASSTWSAIVEDVPFGNAD